MRDHRGARAPESTAASWTLEAALELTPFPDLPREDIRAPLQRTLAQLRGELD